MKIIYIDANPTLLFKNAYIVDNYIKGYEKIYKSVFVSFDSAYEDPEISANSIENLVSNENKMFFRMPAYKPKYIEKYLKSEKPDYVVLCGYRVPDIVWLAVCNKLGIKTIYYQHGFDINHVKRKIGSMLKDYLKVIKYTIGVIRLAFYLGVNPIVFGADYIKFVVFGANFKGSLFEDTRLWPNKFFVYSEYYIKFWKEKIGILGNRIGIMGATDLMKIEETQSRTYEHSICYLAQTFVEDGRISRSHFQQIIDQYILLAHSVKKLCIKLHPRSDLSLYSVFNGMENVELVRDYFPYSSIYISHYSSTVFLARHLSNNVIIHDLPSDPSPEIFKEVSSLVSSDIKEIIAYSQIHINDDSARITKQNETLDYIAPIPPVNPLQTVANCIMDLKKNE